MQRGSQRDSDEIAWNSVGLRLGGVGLDLRSPSDPGALVELLNARFRDDRTIQQRNGHIGTLIRDGSDLAPTGTGVEVSGNWVYGHGMQLSNTNASGWENAHHPFPGRGAGVIRFEGSDVVWTGDRLLVIDAEGGPALGGSTFWYRSTPGTTQLPRGIPAFLPLQTDSHPPSAVTGNYVETCLTDKYRVFIHTEPNVPPGTGSSLYAWILDRVTGALIDRHEISGASNDPVEPRVFQSAGYIVVLWRDATSKVLYRQYWSGTQWAGESVIHADVYAYDVVPVSGGFHLLWREGSPSPSGIFLGKYSGVTAQSQPYTFRTPITTNQTPAGVVALGVSPTGDLGILYEGTGIHATELSPKAVTIAGATWLTLSGFSGWTGGASICSRGLRESNNRYEWVVHASRGDSTGVMIRSFTTDSVAGTIGDTASTVRYNSRLASKSFRVGDEVFCWLRSSNAGTHYLVGGVYQPQVSGFADREEAISRTTADGNYGIPMVASDPLDTTGTKFTWIRPYNTGQTYTRGGNVRIGDLDFLPALSTATFGQSVYLSGSAVRNYDGVELGDAGFQDYPVVQSNAVTGTGGSIGTGDFYFQVYPVRYNKRGERFQGAAVTYGPVTVSSGSTNTITLTISTLPCTNHSDVQFEVYRTEAGGTAFYLDGVVANSLSAATVSYAATRKDRSTPLSSSDLVEQTADSHAAGVGALSEIEEWGPLGCAILAVSGDRLWGAGGQVPAGVVQFSKLHEDGEGAGFDDLAGFQVVDTEGNTITSVARLNDVTVVFEELRTYVFTDTGPDNYGRGTFGRIITLADGAITNTTILTPLGLVFWGASGPRLLDTNYQSTDISQPVKALAETMTPTGVRVDYKRREVIWYTAEGDALLWNYLGAPGRWARWDGLPVAGVSSGAIITTDGRLMVEDADTYSDDGQSIAFVWRTSNLRAEQLLLGATLLRAIGLVGEHHGAHTLRLRVYYNGSPLWTDQWEWQPDTKTWLDTVGNNGALTPAQVDALGTTDHSGAYRTHKRTSRHECSYFQVEVSNSAYSLTYTPTELSLELGARGGLARVPVNTFTP